MCIAFGFSDFYKNFIENIFKKFETQKFFYFLKIIFLYFFAFFF